jgi:imidazole glycerol phosphate synthase glutamine amidotransferase subunit
MLTPLREAFAENKPFLGICLGLQALYESSEEAPGVPGLGLLPGCVTRFQGVFKVPHVGWSQLNLRPNSALFRGVADFSFVYYCHSYYGPVTADASAVTEYGQTFAAGIERNNLWAVQFHPEKSGEVGLQVLRNFLSL